MLSGAVGPESVEMNLALSFLSPGKIKVEIFPPISTKDLTTDDVDELAKQCYTTMRETFFKLSGKSQEANGEASILGQ